MSKYKPTIGLEVHAELKTESKMFCGCKNAPHESEPNSNTCPVCLAHPGTLPVPNQSAIKHLLMFGEAVNATRATYTEFDRKHYFYPDIPKAYQISQFAFPFLSGGSLCGVTLTRVHLEEDTARSQHDKGDMSVVDFNRAGVPLMELVTEPVMHDAETAVKFARELQLLLRTLGISGAQMERGEMRVEANISVSSTEGELGTKVEVKNINSFRSVESAIVYEIERQMAVLEKGESVAQETRGWDEVRLRTFSQRSKETAKDYRYFPDPDIPKLDLRHVDDFDTSRLSEIMPSLPDEKREKYSNLGIPSSQIELIIGDSRLDNQFSILYSSSTSEGDVDPKKMQLAANYLTTDVLSIMSDNESTDFKLEPENFSNLIDLLFAGEINSRIAKDILSEICIEDIDPRQIVEERGLSKKTDSESIKTLAKQVIEENMPVAIEFKNGKETSLKFLVGQGMKLSKGTAEPSLLSEMLVNEIDKL